VLKDFDGAIDVTLQFFENQRLGEILRGDIKKGY